jgi:hypothetical protein
MNLKSGECTRLVRLLGAYWEILDAQFQRDMLCNILKYMEKMVHPTRFERVTSAFGGQW